MTGDDPRGDAAEALAHRLEHVVWIGGGSGAGKSTIARRLAAQHGMALYPTDDAMSDHVRRSTPASAPLLHDFVGADLDQRWVARSPQRMLESFGWFAGEAFALVVEDLLALPRSPAVVVEGFRLLPHLVAPLLTDRTRAVWLLPTPRFRRSAFEARGSLWSIAARTSDPARALANLLERDRLFTDRTAEDVRRLGLTGIDVDGSTPEDALTAQVGAALGL